MNTQDSITLCHVTMPKDDLINWRDYFKVMDSADRLRLISKETFDHGKDDEPFNNMKYKFVLMGDGTDFGVTIEDENGKQVEADYYSLHLIPAIECVDDSVLKEMGSFYGLDDMSIDELRKELNECDLANEGYGVPLGSEAVKACTYKDKERCGWSIPWDEGLINAFATAANVINGIKGFWLDRPLNGAGMTGWDFLEMALTDKSFNDFSLRRFYEYVDNL